MPPMNITSVLGKSGKDDLILISKAFPKEIVKDQFLPLANVARLIPPPWILLYAIAHTTFS